MQRRSVNRIEFDSSANDFSSRRSWGNLWTRMQLFGFFITRSKLFHHVFFLSKVKTMWGTFTIHQWCHTHFSESMIGSVAGAGVWSPLGAVSVLFGWGQKSKFHEVSHTRMLSSSRTNFRSDWAFNSLLTSTRSNRKAKFWFLNDPPKRGDSFFFCCWCKIFFLLFLTAGFKWLTLQNPMDVLRCDKWRIDTMKVANEGPDRTAHDALVWFNLSTRWVDQIHFWKCA